MKNGTLYAKRLKDVFQKLRGAAGGRGGPTSRPPAATEGPAPPPVDPTEQLVIAILGAGSSLDHGRRAYKQLLGAMIDLNEIRVSPAGEVAAVLRGTIPDAAERADALVRALNAVFKKEHAVSLAKLSNRGVRDARLFLEQLDGVGPYAAASVVHWCLEGHAIPVSVPLLAALKGANLAHPEASVDEVQAFLERNINAADARQFVLTMESFSPPAAARPTRRASAAKASSNKADRKTVTAKKRG